jgi:DNA-binding GntR family transcriptional regulator
MKTSLAVGEAGAAGAAYREIKRRIINASYAPGQKLSEARLSVELGVGRSPIRTALARLQGERWIAVSPQSGTYVRGLSGKEIDDVLEFRLVLETHVAGLAAKRIGDAALRKLRRAFDAFGPTVASNRVDEYLELDLDVHVAIYHAAGNELITQNLLDLIDKVRWIRRGSMAWPLRIREAYQEVERVLQGLERRDSAAARNAMRAHIENIIKFRKDIADHAMAGAGGGSLDPHGPATAGLSPTRRSAASAVCRSMDAPDRTGSRNTRRSTA